ncbi:MAG TPA: hypothetical protein VFF81_14855 [Noviherbaspirillum sp.]|nr:hypothetical protein [Noviherbaspirillum sp.]
MNSVTLTYSELIRLLKVYTYAFIIVAAILTVGRHVLFEAPLITAAIQSVGISILVITTVLGVVTKKAWTSPRWANWLERPVVHGLWWGMLYTEYRAKNDQPLAPIPIAFVIRQRYLFLSIQSFTKDLPAGSTMESLHKDEKTSDVHLSYVFEMKRHAYAENKITTGYGALTLQDSGQKLCGNYWTNSPTQGRLELTLVQRDCDSINSFDAAERQWKKSCQTQEEVVSLTT